MKSLQPPRNCKKSKPNERSVNIRFFCNSSLHKGRRAADIQTEWHAYYTSLPEAEKHEVWQEFYAANEHTPYQKLFQKQTPVASRSRLAPVANEPTQPAATTAPRVVTSENGITIADHTPVRPDVHTRPSEQSRLSKTKVRAGQAVRKTKVGNRVLDSQAAEATRRIKQRIQHKVSAGGPRPNTMCSHYYLVLASEL